MPKAAVLAELVPQLHDAIRQGNRDFARRELRRLGHRKIPREHALAIASVARRAGMPELAIRVLNPIVRPSHKLPVRASLEERAEYAACLAYIGASDEALTILRSLDAGKYPQILIYETFALVSQWKYEDSIPILKRYIAADGIDPYQRLVGKVNLAAALNFERRHRETETILGEILDETEAKALHLLQGNALELTAQNAIFQRKWDEARDALERAAKALKDAGGFDEFFVRKWKAILELVRRPKSATSLADVKAIAVEARERQNWEIARDCDRFEAITQKNARLLTHLYFGTPFESFRRRMLADFGGVASLPHEYHWRLDETEKAKLTLDVLTGESSSGATLKVGQTLHRLLVTLASDFYRPFRLASIYARLYPDEFFNPITSPARVHQATKLLKAWFREHRLPVTIAQAKGLYRLSASGACTVRIAHQEMIGDRHKVSLMKLQARWAGKMFSVREACEALGVSPMSVLRLLQRALREGSVKRIGRAASTRYQFVATQRGRARA